MYFGHEIDKIRTVVRSAGFTLDDESGPRLSFLYVPGKLFRFEQIIKSTGIAYMRILLIIPAYGLEFEYKEDYRDDTKDDRMFREIILTCPGVTNADVNRMNRGVTLDDIHRMCDNLDHSRVQKHKK